MLPASASVNINLVEDMLSANLKSVVTSKSVGNTDSCNTFVVNIVISIITTESVIFNANKTSNTPLGNGIIIIRTIPITPIATSTSKFSFKFIFLLFIGDKFIPSFI